MSTFAFALLLVPPLPSPAQAAEPVLHPLGIPVATVTPTAVVTANASPSPIPDASADLITKCPDLCAAAPLTAKIDFQGGRLGMESRLTDGKDHVYLVNSITPECPHPNGKETSLELSADLPAGCVLTTTYAIEANHKFRELRCAIGKAASSLHCEKTQQLSTSFSAEGLSYESSPADIPLKFLEKKPALSRDPTSP